MAVRSATHPAFRIRISRFRIPGACAIALLILSSPVQVESAPAAPWVGESFKGVPCASFGLTQGFGPYDYTNPAHVHKHLEKVEEYHFTQRVRTLQGGQSTHRVLGDITYTLSAFPNHHAALFSMIRYHTEKGFADRDLKAGRISNPLPPECWLQRAANFSPADATVPFLFGLYLHRIERFELAEDKYRAAIEMKPRSAEFHYNLGLLLTRMDRYEDARAEAQQAYRLGYPLPGLRERLARAGYPLQ